MSLKDEEKIRLKEHSDEVRDLYDSWAMGYDRNFIDRHKYAAPRHVFNAVAAATDVERPGFKVLDVGVGTGLLSAEFRKVNGQARLSGIDISRNMLDECHDKHIMDNLQRGDFQADPLPYDDNAFDATVSSGVFELLEKPGLVIAEMARVTKPGGVIAFTTVSPRTIRESMLYPFVAFLYAMVGMFADYEGRRHSPAQLTRALKKNGIDLIGGEQFTGYNKMDRDTPYTLYIGRKPG